MRNRLNSRKKAQETQSPIICEICAPVQFHRYAFNYGSKVDREIRRKRERKQSTNSASAVPDYVGPFRDGTAPCASQKHVNPAFLEIVFEQLQNAKNGSLN